MQTFYPLWLSADWTDLERATPGEIKLFDGSKPLHTPGPKAAKNAEETMYHLLP